MNLARYSITPTERIQILDAHFDVPDAHIFTASTPTGFAVYRTCPLQLLRKREFTAGTLASVVPLHTSSLLFLVGGGPSPLYPPNKVIVWDEALGREVAELEFRERVRGIACRRGWLIVALRRRAVAFEVGDVVTRYHEWDTCDNQQGLVALATATHSTLLAIAGRQTGHVQLIHLPPCRPSAPKLPPSPTLPRSAPPLPKNHPVSVIAAHESALSTLTVLPSGRLLATTSSRGTLLRIWDSHSGKLLKEFRRGSDKAGIYGVAFRPDEQDVCVWSDKGTIHVFSLSSQSGSSNRQSSLSPLTPFLSLPKYFDSEWSYAQYRIPSQTSHVALSAGTSGTKLSDAVEDEKCTVAWIKVPTQLSTKPSAVSGHVQPTEYQLVALTYSGGWYRIALPSSSDTVSLDESKTNAVGSSGSVRSGRPSPLGRANSAIGSSATGRTRADKGKQKESSRESKSTHSCILKEYRRYGRWDGWG